MPMASDPGKGGTNSDGSKSGLYCSFCYQDGEFTDEGITLTEKINKLVKMATEMMGMPESEARSTAESVLPGLKRWSSH